MAAARGAAPESRGAGGGGRMRVGAVMRCDTSAGVLPGEESVVVSEPGPAGWAGLGRSPTAG